MVFLPNNPVFRRLYAAQVSSLLGSGLLTVALALLAARLADDNAGAVLGTALTIKMVAYVAMAPVMRAACERLPRTTVLVGADIVRLLMVALLPLVTDVWQIYVLVFALQTASATFTPVFTATIPAVLDDRDDYTGAVAASRIAYDLEALASPALAAALLFVVAPPGLFLIAATGFAASALLVGSVRGPLRGTAPPAAPDTPAPFHRRATSGLRIMLSQSTFRGLIAINLCCAAATAPVMVYSVVYVHTELGMGATALAALLAACGIGSLCTALALPIVSRRLSPRATALAGALAACGSLVLTTVTHLTGLGYPGLSVAWFVAGVGTSLMNTSAPRLIADHTDTRTADDVFTAQFSASHAAFLLTYPIAGATATLGAGGPAVLFAVAVVGLTAAALTWHAPAGRAPAPSAHRRAPAPARVNTPI
ncbi:MFS transporter [Gordonia pseudamarae]|jgi:Na+/melibiose symporter-like transporter|uniref:MFS transporter n=1 Tax=Gordonia pseudamarae TaxID=2831662 RepID=A0ABX6IEI7_9ACTN|nr:MULTISPECIES: MFS transporter [Gordonia]MBD0023970.1 MFS transporter [Gordonia sp. (in: high G+C Gram-positive bacteria)]QHN24800.1 MFS transporter [Gordonia pseudamarae]QHN33733.1 MFS transporter [Gordonia pseudamarae]